MAAGVTAPAAGPAPRAGGLDIVTLRNQVAAFGAFRDQLAKEMPPVAQGTGDGCLVLDLAGAAHGNDLHVEILRKGGAWIEGRAHALRWNLDMHAADGSALTFDGTRAGGTLAVHLTPWSDRRETDPERGIPVTCRWALDLRATLKGTLAGTAKLENPREAPHPAETLTVTGRWVPFGGAPAFPTPQRPDSVDLFADVEWFGEQVAGVYADIRAMAISRKTGLPFSVARENVARFKPVRRDPAAAETGAEEAPPPKKGKGPQKPAHPSVDDPLETDIGDEAGPKPAAGKTAGSDAMQAAMKGIAEHMAAMRAEIEMARAASEPAAAQGGDTDPGDPEFGPWQAVTVLPKSRSGASLLPADAGADGPQVWSALASWQAIGPFALNLWTTQTPLLPDIVPSFDAGLGVEVERFNGLCSIGAYKGTGVSRWETVRTDPRNGLLTPPAWIKNHRSGYMVAGTDFAAFYAVADVESPADGDVWAAAQGDDRAFVWANSRLVWTSGPVEHRVGTYTWRLRLPLKKGTNRILVRVESTKQPHRFGLKLCVRGKPRPADMAQSETEKRETAYAKVTPPQAGYVGFRYDQSGNFPGPAPVAAWDLARGINVLWTAKLGSNFGPPTVAGGRVFTWEDPFTIVCLDAADGNVLWRAPLDTLEFADPEAWARAQKIRAELATLGDDKEKNARRTELRAELDKLYQSKCGHAASTGDGYQGPCMSTPISDGKKVWVRAVANVVACFDRDGKRLWAKPTRPVGSGMGHKVSSPVLVAGKLISQVPRYGVPKGGPSPAADGASGAAAAATKDGPTTRVDVDVDDEDTSFVDRHVGRRQVLMAWDAETGEELWTTRDYTLPHFGNRYDADGIATPVPLRLTDGKQTLDVILTNGGQVFRVEDGALIAENSAFGTDPAPTAVSDGRGVAYFLDCDYGGHSGSFGRALAVRFLLRGRDRVDAHVLWDRHFQEFVFSGFLLSGELLHTFHGYRQARSALSTLEAPTGLHRGNVGDLSRNPSGEEYSPPARAGGLIAVVDTARSERNRFLVWKNPQWPPEERQPLLPGSMTVLLAGAPPVVLARNNMDGVSTSTAISDGRLYVRTRTNLFCLGRTGAEGEKYEAEQVAATLLAQMELPAPAEGEPVEPKAQTKLPYEYVPEPILLGRHLGGWACTAPASDAEAGEVGRKFSFPAGDGLAAAGGKGRGSADVRSFSRREESIYPSDHMTETFVYGAAFDLARVHQGKAGAVCLWSTIVCSDRERVVRLDLDQPGVKFWIGGTPVENGRRVLLKHGNYLLAMETRLTEGAAKEVPFRVRFWSSEDVGREKEQRRAFAERVRSWLEKAVALVPDTEAGRRSQALLRSL